MISIQSTSADIFSLVGDFWPFAQMKTRSLPFSQPAMVLVWMRLSVVNVSMPARKEPSGLSRALAQTGALQSNSPTVLPLRRSMTGWDG